MAILIAEENKNNAVVLNGIIIIGVDPGLIEIPLHWLKVSGFKGKLQIMGGEFSDTSEPLFEIDV